jgi:hypothetical protein
MQSVEDNTQVPKPRSETMQGANPCPGSKLMDKRANTRNIYVKIMNEPAFPIYTEDMPVEGTPGMSKRFYAACKAMEGIMASMGGGLSNPNENTYRFVAKQAFAIADEMLKEENQ